MKTFNEFVSLSERPLTKGEEDKKEDIVKGMKKDKKGFEARYGDDAKSVMYATATKLAKEETETVGGVTVLQDYDSTIQFREYEVIDIVKPEPMKGMASEQKELEPEPTVDQEPSKEDEQIKKKEKKVNIMKRQILMKKMQAVRSGAGGDIVAHHEPELEMVEELTGDLKKDAEKYRVPRGPGGNPLRMGDKVRSMKSNHPLGQLKVKYGADKVREYYKKNKAVGEEVGGMDEGLVDMVKKGAKRHAKAVEKKKIKNRKAVPYAALGASYEPEGEMIEEAGCETKNIDNKGKKKINPEKNPVVEAKAEKKGRHPRDQKELDKAQEYIKKNPNFGKVSEAKVDKGRSDYGKATIRNWRRSGPDTVEPAMFDPENKRGKTIDKRREEHKARRGVKKAKVPTYTKEETIDEEGYDRMRDKHLERGGIGAVGSHSRRSTNYHSRPDTPEQKKRKQAASDQAYKSVVDKLKKRYGDGVMTSSRKIRNGKEVK